MVGALHACPEAAGGQHALCVSCSRWGLPRASHFDRHAWLHGRWSGSCRQASPPTHCHLSHPQHLGCYLLSDPLLHDIVRELRRIGRIVQLISAYLVYSTASVLPILKGV